MKKLIVDLDGTITLANTTNYDEVLPNVELIEKLRTYQQEGFEITIATARNMRTYDGNVGKINANTLPVILTWLKRHNVPYDEIIVGKPWCGYEGFYIDDRAIRPSEFIALTKEDISTLIDKEKKCI